jgi:hypothetical protein
MRAVKKNILTFITHHHILSLLISLSVFIPLLVNVPKIKTVSSIDEFKLYDHPDSIFYDKCKMTFGNDEFFVIAFEADTIFSTETLMMLLNITNDLELLQEVREVKSLANIEDLKGSEEYFEVSRFLDEIPTSPEKCINLRKKAVSNKFYVSNIISPDAKTAAIIVYTYDSTDDAEYRKNLIRKTNAVLDKYRSQQIRFYLAGSTILNNDISLYMEKDTAVFIPVTYILITIFIWIFFRNIRLTAIAVLNISICLGATMGLLAVCGITLNNVTAIVPPLIMALALSDTVHIFSHLETKRLKLYPHKQDALLSVLSDVFAPCFLTTLTTAVGFASLMTSELAPIRNFGFVSSCGMLFEFFFSFLFLPPLLLFFRSDKIFTIDSDGSSLSMFLSMLAKKVQAHSKWIVIIGGMICVTSIIFAKKIDVETDFVKYFKKESPVRTAFDFVERKMSGVGSLDIAFSSKEVDAFKEPANLKVIEAVQTFLDSLEDVDVTCSLVDFIKDMNESFHNENHAYYSIPDKRQLISQYLLLYDSEDIEDFVTVSYDQARISARLSVRSSSAKRHLINTIKSFIESSFLETDIDIRVTGKAIQEVGIIDSLVRGQVTSLLIASLIIGLCMFVVFRSFRLGIICFMPNLFPLIINFGIMGACKVPLNTATSLISAVALGIVVDDTVHFISAYRLQREKQKSIVSAVETAILGKGRAIIATTLILSMGFLILGFSSFVPTIQFGLLTTIIMLTAVVGDLVWLPAIFLLKK